MNRINTLKINSLLMLAFILGGNISAQEKKEVLQNELSYLTTEQRQLLKEQQALLDNTRSIFKKNLTSEQLTLLKNSSLSIERRTALLKTSLSADQRRIISTNRQMIRAKKNMFRRSLTKKQRVKLRRFIKKRPLSDRKRLVRRLRRLIQNNMD